MIYKLVKSPRPFLKLQMMTHASILKSSDILAVATLFSLNFNILIGNQFAKNNNNNVVSYFL